MHIPNLVVISDPDRPYLDVLKQLPYPANLTIGNNAADLKDAVAEAEIIVNTFIAPGVLHEVFPYAQKLKWLHSLSAGIEHIVVNDAVRNSPVPLTNAKGVYSTTLGEFSMLAMLFFAKDVRRFLRNQAAKKWEQYEVVEMRGQTVGVLGYGDIGKAAAVRAKGFGMKVIALRRNPGKSAGDGIADEMYGPDKKMELIAASDYLVLAMPATPDTIGIIGEAELKAMKKDAVIINVGRGSAIQEAKLIEALQAGTIRGAGLDVFEVEPLPVSSPLWEMENVFMSPHTADRTATWLNDSCRFFLSNYKRYLEGLPLENITDKSVGY